MSNRTAGCALSRQGHGKDRNSRVSSAQLQITLDAERETSDIRVFAIAHGSGAKPSELKLIAHAGRGKAFVGTVDDIRKVFRDIATFC